MHQDLRILAISVGAIRLLAPTFRVGFGNLRKSYACIDSNFR